LQNNFSNDITIDAISYEKMKSHMQPTTACGIFLFFTSANLSKAQICQLKNH